MKTLERATSLQRFHAAHGNGGAYDRALREIRQGRKRNHWMWFVFPQLRALGKSETARYYGIADRAEAVAYIDDPVLRLRLGECTTAILGHRKLMLTYPDNHKLRSCMTLFARVTADPTLPNAVLAKFFDGKPDQLTLDVLAGKPITLPPSARPTPKPQRWEQGMLRMPVDTEAWSRERITSFVRSFGLSSVATRQMVDAWMADRGKAMGAVWATLDERGDDRYRYLD
jgi:uncharacterized protein (DUF1810 family)